MSADCKQAGCNRPGTKARGYCVGHYARFVRGQDMTPPLRPKLSEAERFWTKVEKTDTCWNWTAAKFKGYGIFRHQGAARVAHRISYAWEYGPIPDGIEIDHMCHNHSCVNPKHLRPATKILNGQNRSGLNSNNKSGVRGVHWATAAGCWIAKGHLNGRPVTVGRFDDLEEAARAIAAWRKDNMPYSLMDQKKAS